VRARAARLPAARLLKGRLRLAAAEVGQRPGRVAQHRDLGVVLELAEQRHQRVALQHQVAALWGVARNVAQRPHRLQPGSVSHQRCWHNKRRGPEAQQEQDHSIGLVADLLPDIVAGRGQQLYKDGHGPVVDHHPRVLGGAGRHVRERPGRLKLARATPVSSGCSRRGGPCQGRAAGRTCSCGTSWRCRNCTNRGMTPWPITSSMGGFRSARPQHGQPGAAAAPAPWPRRTQA